MSEKSALNHIIVKGARQHNLKNIDIDIPKNKFVVFTGVSGSGKSSLAMDTIYADGQRRYVESLSAYARQFLGVMDKPDVDSIEGLSPAIAIDQKTTSRNPRSTVGTITEIYDFLRLLFARVGHPHCPNCGREIQRQSAQEIVDQIINIVSNEHDFSLEKGARFFLLAPVVKDRKGEFTSLFENLKKQSIVRVRLDKHFRNLNDDLVLIKTNKHSVDAVISRQILSKTRLNNAKDKATILSEIYQSVETSLRLSNGYVILTIVKDKSFEFLDDPKDTEDHLFSENFACPACNISLPEIEPRTFSFNSPHGACPACDGLGTQLEIDIPTLYNPELTIEEGGFYPWSNAFDGKSWTGNLLRSVCKEYDIPVDIPISQLKDDHMKVLLYGIPKGKKVIVNYESRDGNSGSYKASFEGLVNNLMRRHKETNSDFMRRDIEKYMVQDLCPTCLGTRLKKESLSIVILGQNINQICDLAITDCKTWFLDLQNHFTLRENKISETILKEINYRLKFLEEVGLGYLSLGRSSGHLSGGEAQRIRLASQIGSGLSGVLYVLDEPSIGLHQRDQGRLIKTLKHLRDLGNTVLVVEHDAETMLESDYIFDFGPGAGEKGGKLMAEGTPEDLKKDPKSLTGLYLSGKRKVGEYSKNEKKRLEQLLEEETNGEMMKKHKDKFVILKNATGRNLKGVDLKIPLGKFVCITGVSGSGKSTLVMDTFYRALRNYFNLKNDERSEPYEELLGGELIDKVIAIDQNPIGRTPKSNPATYTKTFDEIRELFSQTEDAKIRGYKPGRFSFNVKGGRCENCGGEGQIKIEMQFMPDVYVNCEVCEGKRYNREALEIRFKDKTIADVLDMPVDEALEFFDRIPKIRKNLQTLQDVGLGYIKLGQPAPTLSGGEAQRVKLALELSKSSRGHTLYILDEPTTGLHFADLEKLIAIVKRLTSRGHTVVVIEHNLDVISNCDYVVDLGPEGGKKGGEIVFEGELTSLLKEKIGYTGQALAQMSVKA